MTSLYSNWRTKAFHYILYFMLLGMGGLGLILAIATGHGTAMQWAVCGGFAIVGGYKLLRGGQFYAVDLDDDQLVFHRVALGHRVDRIDVNHVSRIELQHEVLGGRKNFFMLIHLRGGQKIKLRSVDQARVEAGYAALRKACKPKDQGN